MFEISKDEKGGLCFTGEVQFGRLGTFRTGAVSIEMEDDFLKKLGALNEDGTAALKKIEAYLSAKIENINLHIEQVENRFLLFLFHDYFSCGDAFWADEESGELCAFIIKDKMPSLEDDETYADNLYAEKLFTEEADRALFQGRNPFDKEMSEYLNTSNIDMRKYIEAHFPMIDLDIFLKSLVGEDCSFSNDTVSIQSSNPECGYCAVCSACLVLADDLTVKSWYHR